MATRLRGALIEYQSDFLGPAPNVVVFQFNPETIERTVTVPPNPWLPAQTDAAGKPAVLESFSLRLFFDASDAMSVGDPLAATFGVGPALAALENMVQPTTFLTAGPKAAMDALAALMKGPAKTAEEPVGDELYPRLLFVWGHLRVLPVEIGGLSIKEQKYDGRLVVVQAEATVQLSVPPVTRSKDKLGYGALAYTRAMREAQAAVNLLATVQAAADLIPF